MELLGDAGERLFPCASFPTKRLRSVAVGANRDHVGGMICASPAEWANVVHIEEGPTVQATHPTATPCPAAPGTADRSPETTYRAAQIHAPAAAATHPAGLTAPQVCPSV